MAHNTAIKAKIDQMNQAAFQILCDALLSREGYRSIVSLGTKEGSEKTTRGTPDSYFCTENGKYIFAEYTTQKQGLFSKIGEDLGKCMNEENTKIPLSDIEEIIYFHTSSNITPAQDRDLKDKCHRKGIKLTLIGIDSLTEKLMGHPSIVKEHLGLPIDSEQIQTIEDFLKQYNANPISATLGTEFMFRKKEIDSIEAAFEKAPIVLLVGPAGIGKTRLGLEYAKMHKSSDTKLLCVHDRALPIFDDLKFYFEAPGKYFVFVDDANQISKLDLVVDYVNNVDEGYQVQILMTVRDYAVSKVKRTVSVKAHYEEVSIAPFSDKEITAIIKNHYGINNELYLERISQIAAGNPRIAMLAGKIACDANRLDSINDVSDLFADYYGQVINEAGLEQNNGLLASAGIVAFLNVIHLEHIDAVKPILKSKNLTVEDFKENLRLLHDHEIVDIYHDKAVRFSEQCLANFVLKYVFYDTKCLQLSTMIAACFTPYREHTIHAVNSLLGVFQSDDLHEYVQSEILFLWNQFDDTESPEFFEFLKAFYPLNEEQALLIIKNQIDSIVSVNLCIADIDTQKGKNYVNASDDIIRILGGFAGLQNEDVALDLFFQYCIKRPDLYMQFYHASTSFFSVQKDSDVYGYQTQLKFFAKIIKYAFSPGNAVITKLFFDVAEHFLRLDFSPQEYNIRSNRLTMYHIPLVLSQGVNEYRELIWDQLIALAATSSDHDKIKHILHSYGKTIHDCSNEVIRSDFDDIIKLTKLVLHPENLADCLIAQSLQDVFENANIQTDELERYFVSQKYSLYRVIWPTCNDDVSYAEIERRKEDGIRSYVVSQKDRPVCFSEIMQLYLECANSKDHTHYEIAEGINIALKALADCREEYITCAKKVIASDMLEGINIYQIVETLFTLLSPEEVYAILSRCHPQHKNEWLFEYYREIPENMITPFELEGLYSFLKDDSDREIQMSSYRDVVFLDKFIPYDKNVVINASKIIFAKKEYSPFIVNIYFRRLFLESKIAPAEVLEKFRGDMELLKQIFLYLLESDPGTDYDGCFLRELLKTEPEFLKEYTIWFAAQAAHGNLKDGKPSILVFYQTDNYIDTIDYLLDVAYSMPKNYFNNCPIHILKRLLVLQKEDSSIQEKCDKWIEHYIEKHCNEKEKMHDLFAALSETSMTVACQFFKELPKYSVDIHTFKSLPLVPLSYSWSGSCVPLYSSWIDHLERLLPSFSGLEYLEHKKTIMDKIEHLRYAIKEEEISDIIEG